MCSSIEAGSYDVHGYNGSSNTPNITNETVVMRDGFIDLADYEPSKKRKE